MLVVDGLPTDVLAVDAPSDTMVALGKVRSIDVTDALVTGGPHAEFPMLVSISATWLRSSSNGGDVARDDGFDIYFTSDQAGVSRYAFEVESYSPSTGELVAWVKLPLAAASLLYLHYGDPAVTTSLADPTNVWTAGYELVAHHNGGGDSTGKNTLAAAALTQATGRIAMARDFNGTTSSSTGGSLTAVDDIFAGGGVLEGWFLADTYGGGGFGRLFEKLEYALFVDTTNTQATSALTFYHSTTGMTGYWHWNNINMVVGAWHHVALVYNQDSIANDPVAFIDGVLTSALRADVPSGTMDSDGASTLYIGQRANADRGFDGRLDEMRMSSTVHTDGWYITQYRNQSNPAAFYTVSAPL